LRELLKRPISKTLAPSSGKKFSDNPLLFGNYAPGYVDKNGYAKLRGKVVLHFDVFAKMIFEKQTNIEKCAFSLVKCIPGYVYIKHIYILHIYTYLHI